MTRTREVKRFFSDVRKAQNSLESLKLLSEQVFTQLARVNKPFTDIKIQTSLTNRQEELRIKLVELNLKIEAKKIEIIERLAMAEDIISALPKKEYQDVLRLYYCTRQKDGLPMTFEKVGDRLGYSERHIKRLHAEALEKCKPFFKKNT